MPVVSTPVKKRPFQAGSPASTRAYICAGESRGDRTTATGSASFDFESEATMGERADVTAGDVGVGEALADERFGVGQADDVRG